MEGKLITDTSNFFSIDRGDIVQINGRRYKVTGHERERRFGVEDPKFWVKRVIDTETGEKKIVKLSFFETFKLIFFHLIPIYVRKSKIASILSV